ncbi:MAG TPA: squalene/phytoene synthase family protein [Chloroflexota bacterium]|nr:squalene/phytoene synthase family protein [Chloroflexota bacterium]
MKPQYEMLRSTSRTFALSIEQLPTIVRDAITLAYLLLRVSDYLEDNETMPASRKAELLDLWERVLKNEVPVEELTRAVAGSDSSDSEAYVAQNAHVLLAQLRQLPEEIQEIIKGYVGQTTTGMARWQRDGPFIGTEDEMDDYMHHVAGIVGYLITDIFAWHSSHIRERRDELLPLSREYGLALQTVNIIRGMRKDYERGWVFVPRTFYEKIGLTHHELFDARYIDQAMEVVEMLAVKAETHLRHGIDYIAAFPRRHHRIRLACMWPLFFAARTLAVSRRNQGVLLDEAKIGRDEVKRIMRDTTFLGWSNHWVRWYYRVLLQPPGRLERAPSSLR